MGSNMQVAVKIFFVVFWVSPFTLAQDQECLKKDIDFENTQKSGLQNTYKHGEVVKLNCVTGYVGHLKLVCENGQWIKVIGRDCKKRPCGHPGDTPNGDFQLIRETEFVFGATVEYTCRLGYVMASRVNYRNCRSQGWDNAIPICEVVKCPIISNLDSVTVSGNTEDASYGDVIHFECESPNKMLAGKEDIHCRENGEWSDEIPKCIDIKCLPPIIPHGFTVPNKEYKENEILLYRCEEGYNSRPGNPKCTKYGWSIKPECEEIVCLLELLSAGIASTNPRGKNIFKAGHSVEIICIETHWVYGTKQQSGKIECLKSGKWQSRPLCEEITCENPSDEHISHFLPWGHNFKLNEEIEYSCKNGYTSQANKATCTKNGWEPKPQCIENNCPKPEIAHGKVVGSSLNTYKLNTAVHIECDDGYEPEIFFVTCKENRKWDKMQSCSLKVTCPEPHVQNGFTNKLGQSYLYTCDSKYKPFDGKWWEVLICTDGHWSYEPQCIRKDQCGVNVQANHSQENKVYENEETAEFKCQSKPCCFKCVRGEWQRQDCKLDEKLRCPDPVRNINNATLIIANLKSFYEEGGKVPYKCDKEGFQFQNGDNATCSEGQWNYPQCIKLVEKVRCPDPVRNINNATLIIANLKSFYEEGGKVPYKCDKEGFQFQNGANATCSEGQWNYPQCIKHE